MLTHSLAALALLAQSAAPAAPGPAAKAPNEIVAAAPAGDWTAIAAADLLAMDLTPDAAGKPRRVVIQLIPAPFSQGWVGNIRTLAAAHWWDGTSVNRVQDNYVVQWGDATDKKPLPAGLKTVSESDYEAAWIDLIRKQPGSTRYDPAIGRDFDNGACSMTDPVPALKPCEQWSRPSDVYADGVLFYEGWPVAAQAKSADKGRHVWPVHCYAMVGVGRNLSPDTGTGAELYTVIGHAPRHLDRNIALVGRVIEGMEHLSSLPRGTEALGFYKTAAERVPIVRVRLASELPAAERPRFEYLSTESASFAAYADARANRRDAFFIRPAGGADICNVPVPVRPAK